MEHSKSDVKAGRIKKDAIYIFFLFPWELMPFDQIHHMAALRSDFGSQFMLKLRDGKFGSFDRYV